MTPRQQWRIVGGMDTRDLVYRLRELLREEDECERAREGYDGGSWGYHGHSFIEAVCNAESRFETAFNDLVDARIRALMMDAR